MRPWTIWMLSIIWVAGAARAADGAISEADIARVVAGQRAPTEAEIATAARLARQPTEAEIAGTPAAAAPRVDQLPVPVSRQNVDVQAVARGYEARQSGRGLQMNGNGARLLVFVSLSMPNGTLARLTEQAAKSGAVLLIRGPKNGSMLETVRSVHELIGSRKVGFGIDPIAFDRFGVKQVPTFVLVKAGAMPQDCGNNQCFAEDTYVSVWGDVSLSYALGYVRDRAVDFRNEATLFLNRLGG